MARDDIQVPPKTLDPCNKEHVFLVVILDQGTCVPCNKDHDNKHAFSTDANLVFWCCLSLSMLILSGYFASTNSQSRTQGMTNPCNQERIIRTMFRIIRMEFHVNHKTNFWTSSRAKWNTSYKNQIIVIIQDSNWQQHLFDVTFMVRDESQFLQKHRVLVTRNMYSLSWSLIKEHVFLVPTIMTTQTRVRVPLLVDLFDFVWVVQW